MESRGGAARRAVVAGVAAAGLLGVVLLPGSPAGATDPPDWHRVVGAAVGDPVVVASAGLDHTDAFVRVGTSLFHQRATADAVAGEDLGGIVIQDPAATATADGAYVFVTGVDEAIYYRLLADDTGVAGPWTRLGGISKRAPSVVTDNHDLVHLFVAGADGAVWTRHQQGGGTWTEWQSLGGVTTSDVAVDTGPDDYAIVAVRGVDGALWTTSNFGGSWNPFSRLGGQILGSPAASGGQIAVRGTDNQVYLVGNGFFPTGGFITGDPTLADGWFYTIEWRFTVAGRGPDGAIYEEAWGRGRSGWGRIDSNISSTAEVARLDPFDVCDGMCAGERWYVTAPDGYLYTLFG